MAKKSKSPISKQQKAFLDVIKTMPKVTTRSTESQVAKLYDWIGQNQPIISTELGRVWVAIRDYLKATTKPHNTQLSARGWHKDHYNYNKAEKHELPPSLRRTPARNVTKAGTKRKRKTNIKRYK